MDTQINMPMSAMLMEQMAKAQRRFDRQMRNLQSQREFALPHAARHGGEGGPGIPKVSAFMEPEQTTAKKRSGGRPAWTYRCARRNKAKKTRADQLWILQQNPSRST